MRLAPWNRRLPYLLLGVALVLLLVLQNGIVGFGPNHHGFLSSHGAALAKNLSFGSRLLLFHSAELTESGQVAYASYNRFPLFPFAIVKVAAMLPFEPELSRQVYAARQIMNVFLGVAMLFAFLAVRAWIGEPYLALAAVFLTFSSFYVLYYSDMVFNDVPALFGVCLVAWVAIRSRTAPLSIPAVLVAAIVAVSMGWQPFAVLGAWFVTDLVLFAWAREGSPLRLLRRPATLALAAAIVWGVAVLGTQVLNEAAATGAGVGRVNTIHAMLFRLGAGGAEQYAQHAQVLAWPEFLARQAERIVLVFAPLRLAPHALGSLGATRASEAVVILALAIALARIVRSRFVTWRPFAIVLIASGFIWAIPMRHFVAFHDFQTIFYLGLPLTVFTGLLLWLPRRLTLVPALLGLVVFAANVYDINLLKTRGAGQINQVTRDFEAIYRLLPPHSKVSIAGDRHAMGIGHHAVDFYMAGHYFAPPDRADYVISTNPSYGAARLTANPYANLFARR